MVLDIAFVRCGISFERMSLLWFLAPVSTGVRSKAGERVPRPSAGWLARGSAIISNALLRSCSAYAFVRSEHSALRSALARELSPASMDMTQKALAAICKQHGLYKTARLNDKLFANFQGFKKLANLEAYTGLKALFVEGNALTSLEGLPPLEELRCLYAPLSAVNDR
jgi:hypothetical protein